jgi:hypothetical protein
VFGVYWIGYYLGFSGFWFVCAGVEGSCKCAVFWFFCVYFYRVL